MLGILSRCRALRTWVVWYEKKAPTNKVTTVRKRARWILSFLRARNSAAANAVRASQRRIDEAFSRGASPCRGAYAICSSENFDHFIRCLLLSARNANRGTIPSFALPSFSGETPPSQQTRKENRRPRSQTSDRIKIVELLEKESDDRQASPCLSKEKRIRVSIEPKGD